MKLLQVYLFNLIMLKLVLSSLSLVCLLLLLLLRSSWIFHWLRPCCSLRLIWHLIRTTHVIHARTHCSRSSAASIIVRLHDSKEKRTCKEGIRLMLVALILADEIESTSVKVQTDVGLYS
jgi:hypothetical protein